MTAPPLQPEGSLKREFHRLLRTCRSERRRYALDLPKYQATDLMMQHARLGLAIVQIVARDLRRDARYERARGDRLTVVRSQAGRYWELLVLRNGAPTTRVIAGLRRSPWPPWRLNRLTYFLTPVALD